MVIVIVLQCFIFIQWIYRAYIVKYLKQNNSAPKSRIELQTKSSVSIQSTGSTTPTKSYISPTSSPTTAKTTKSEPLLINIDIKSKLLVTLCILLSLLYGLCVCVFIIYSRLIKSEVSTDKIGIYVFLINIGSRYFLYTYYLRRLYIIFNQSMYKISMKMYIGLSVAVGICYVVYIIYYILYEIISRSLDSTNWSILLLKSRAIIFVTYDILFGVSLLVLFVRRLRNLIKLNENMHENSKDIEVTKSLRKAVGKITLLSSITVVTTILAMFAAIIDLKITIIPSLFDSLINSICLVLTFNAYKNMYTKLCCVCDRLCFN